MREAQVDRVTMRFVAMPLAILFVSSGIAWGQTWPSDAQVFREVYGQVDVGGTSVRWDAAKERKPSPYEERSFAENGQEMEVKVLLRAEAGGKFYVATSAVPKVREQDKCHACVAALGGAVYDRANGAWKLEAASPAAIYGGGWGEPPVGLELRRCGERTYCFVVDDGFTGQGYTDVSLKVYGPVGESLRGLLTVPVESDNPDGSTEFSAAVRFVPRASRLPFFDVEAMGVRKRCARGECSSSYEHRVYRYRDGEYSEVPLPVTVPPKAKKK
jgi:hypothetical protein